MPLDPALDAESGGAGGVRLWSSFAPQLVQNGESSFVLPQTGQINRAVPGAAAGGARFENEPDGIAETPGSGVEAAPAKAVIPGYAACEHTGELT